jgi:ribonuclease G
MLKFIKLVSAGKQKDFSLKNFQFEKEIDKDGTITDVLSANQSVLVQIVKEPISTKGPRISSELSLAGRYIVLVPFSDRVSVSQKIEEKRKRPFKETCTIYQTKRIWCYCSHSSRRQKNSRIRPRHAEFTQ